MCVCMYARGCMTHARGRLQGGSTSKPNLKSQPKTRPRNPRSILSPKPIFEHPARNPGGGVRRPKVSSLSAISHTLYEFEYFGEKKREKKREKQKQVLAMGLAMRFGSSRCSLPPHFLPSTPAHPLALRGLRSPRPRLTALGSPPTPSQYQCPTRLDFQTCEPGRST